MSRYQNYRQGEERDDHQLYKTTPFFSTEAPRVFNGGTWDARHLTNFMSRSNYSNWKGDKPNISRVSEPKHKRSYSTRGDHFFKTTKEDRNQSKIGFTPIFPLVSNPPLQQEKGSTLNDFFKSSRSEAKESRTVSGRAIKLRCSPENAFRFEGNAMKFLSTDPITLQHEDHPSSLVSGYQKERMNRLIERRHPHGMTGIDHPQNPQSKYYETFQDKLRIREEPNSHHTFVLDRDWKQKKRSVPPKDEWKQRHPITLRRFRNENVHGYNILTNRQQ